jgi:hypothetical protein
MALGRPPKVKEVEVEAEIKEVTKSGECPWCNYEGMDPIQQKHHAKEENSTVSLVNGRHQCNTCGKIWRVEALGKPWTLELERGIKWAQENKAKELMGGTLRY